MPSNLLLLLPLLGGYAFIHLCYRTHYRAQAIDGHRLVFEAAAAGLAATVVGRLVVFKARNWTWLKSTWDAETGNTPFFGTVCAGVLLAIAAPLLWNLLVGAYFAWQHGSQVTWRYVPGGTLWPVLDHPLVHPSELLELSRDAALNAAVNRSGTDLQKLLHDLATGEDGAGVGLTLADRKLYVGWVTRSPNLRPNDPYLSLIVSTSGFRDKDSLHPRFCFAYTIDPRVSEDRYVVTLPLSEIKSARRLDFSRVVAIHEAVSGKRLGTCCVSTETMGNSESDESLFSDRTPL